jgi:hypothetical protein
MSSPSWIKCRPFFVVRNFFPREDLPSSPQHPASGFQAACVPCDASMHRSHSKTSIKTVYMPVYVPVALSITL